VLFPELIAAHWNFYNGAPFDQKLLNPDQADLALLPGIWPERASWPGGRVGRRSILTTRR